jgi:flavin reductase (DIM6/NTAB) family NADH-FMN oxidoreductase RutF
VKKSIGPRALLFPTPVLIVGTYDRDNRPNAAAVAWGGICCSDPPCVNISLRKATYSFGNILHHRAFTVNVPSEAHWRHSDYFGVASGRDRDKIAETGLTAVKSDAVLAPYIAEFPLNLACRLVHQHELGRHTIFVGEVVETLAEESCLDDKGNPDAAGIRPLAYLPGTGAYFSLGNFLARSHVTKTWGKDKA